MKLHKKTIFAASGLVIAATLAASLSVPTSTAGYSTIGGSLGVGQRDFRVFNNFTDAAANNNNVPHVNFPGHQGAVMSIWKACAEWASVPHAGNGLGDGHVSNPIIGNGGANFDAKFEGTATTQGNTNQNIHSELIGSSGGTLAYCETPISDGWRIKYLSAWTWADGPGSVSGSQIDLQGVAAHEYGHALGLGHSGVSGATMLPSISGTGLGQRSINSDDINGVKAIYGVKSASKPEITAMSGTFDTGSTLTITGSNFSATGNQVWFTKLSSDGVPIKLTGVSSTAGGTQIQVTIPSGAVDGDVMVRLNGSGNSSLSNAWPIDIGGGAAGPFVIAVDPLFGPAGGWTDVEITGAGFTGATNVTFGGTPAQSFNVVNDGLIDAVSPPGALFASVDVEVTTGLGSDTLASGFTYVFDTPPIIDTVSPSSGPTSGGTPVTVSGANVVGVTDVTFGGVSGTGLTITSATSLTVSTPPGSAGDVDVVANGAGTSTIVDGFTYTGGGPGGTFTDLGPSGTGGAFGDPVHTGSGDLTPGGTGFTLNLTNALPVSPAVLFVAIGDGIPSPFKGGTHYAIPIALEIGLATGIGGDFTLPAVIPASIPSGFKFVTQFWVQDALAVLGAAGSNGIKAEVP
jgi:hypothetical protein